ncbi:MAG TPA: hypothetical protein VKV95_07575 [Terriglobia bacterium]|nr:hypothetical protein [Terriglobia bacterium]
MACKNPIDPNQILTAAITVPPPDVPEVQARPDPVRFPWLLFLALFLLRLLLFGAIQIRLGLVKTELVLGGFELLSCVWVFYDAQRSGAPRPFRWALGTLFLWPIVFPWYLVRRRTPQAPCPFVEGIGLPIVFLALVALGILLVIINGPIK